MMHADDATPDTVEDETAIGDPVDDVEEGDGAEDDDEGEDA